MLGCTDSYKTRGWQYYNMMGLESLVGKMDSLHANNEIGKLPEEESSRCNWLWNKMQYL